MHKKERKAAEAASLRVYNVMLSPCESTDTSMS